MRESDCIRLCCYWVGYKSRILTREHLCHSLAKIYILYFHNTFGKYRN